MSEAMDMAKKYLMFCQRNLPHCGTPSTKLLDRQSTSVDR